MIRFWAIIDNTIREGLAKKTIITLLVLNTVIISFFLLALSLGANVITLFGHDLRGLPDDVLRKVEAGVVAFFYQVALFVGIFAIAAFYPSMQEKGTVDLLLSRPMSRFNIFTAKFIGCMLVVFIVMAYLILGTWFIFWLKLGIAHVEYLSTIPIFMLQFLAFMAFIALIGVIFRNATLSAIMAIFIPFLFSTIAFGLRESGIFRGDRFWHGFFETIYWILPKTTELTAWNISIVALEPLESTIWLPAVIWSTVAFAAACYVIGAVIFQKRSY